MRTCIDTHAMSYDELDFAFADLVLAGLQDGLWGGLIDDLSAGLALAASADPAEVRAAALDYRRERGLLASEDLRGWLAARELRAEDLAAHLRRVVARAAAANLPPSHETPSTAELAGNLRAEALLAGALQRCGDLLGRWGGAARARGTTTTPSSSAMMASPGSTRAPAQIMGTLTAPRLAFTVPCANTALLQTGNFMSVRLAISRTPASITSPLTPRAISEVASRSPK